MSQQRQRTVRALSALLAAAALAVVVAACGGASSGSGSKTASAGASPGAASTTAATGDAGIAQAKAIVARYSKPQAPLNIPPLPKRPPKETVAWVFCTTPTCQAGAAQQAFTALGWNFKLVPWDLTKAPASFVQAFDNALAMKPKPDFIGIPQDFPVAVDAKELAEARAEKIPVIEVTSTTGPGHGVIACTSCAPEFEETARLQVATALADAGGKTSMVYGYDPTLLVYAQQFLPAAKAEVKKLSPQSTFSTLQLSLAQPPSETASTVVNYLQRNPDVKYVILAISELGSGLPQALAAAGLSDKVKIVTQAPQLADLQEIAKGQEFASVGAENPESMWRAADALARYSIDGKIPADLVDPVGWHQIITKANVSNGGSGLIQAPGYQQTFKKAWNVGG